MRVEANGPVDTDSILSTLLRHEVAGLTETSLRECTHRRTVVVDDKPVELNLVFGDDGIKVAHEGDQVDPESVVRLVRRWFDLDTDIAGIDRELSSHRRFADQVFSQPGIRITGYPDRWEAAAMIVLGQQVSLGAARTFAGRLVAAYGERQADLLRFPVPGRVASEPVDRLREKLGVTGARARTIRALSGLFSEDSGADAEGLVGLPGIGPWTVACFSIRGSNAPDEFPGSDAVLRRALGGVDSREAELIAERWSPIRSYAAVRLWTEAVGPVTPV
ncbi:MAG: DNA-3-methyladenine glycosylase 2 family protein [Solirubrobacterales bacterium]|nr:DNA-3-methyladenine glycosylase 2 family protein [Solirubrobacterales bacterium]